MLCLHQCLQSYKLQTVSHFLQLTVTALQITPQMRKMIHAISFDSSPSKLTKMAAEVSFLVLMNVFTLTSQALFGVWVVLSCVRDPPRSGGKTSFWSHSLYNYGRKKSREPLYKCFSPAECVNWVWIGTLVFWGRKQVHSDIPRPSPTSFRTYFATAAPCTNTLFLPPGLFCRQRTCGIDVWLCWSPQGQLHTSPLLKLAAQLSPIAHLQGQRSLNSQTKISSSVSLTSWRCFYNNPLEVPTVKGRTAHLQYSCW